MPVTPGAILCYHGILDAGFPARAPVHVSVEQFDAGLGLFRRLGEIVPLSDLLGALESGRPTRGLLAVTFDDAYEVISRVALPVLQAHRAPATVFAVSGAVAVGGTFWWDRLLDLEPKVEASRWRAFVQQQGLERDHIVEAGHGRLTPAQEAGLASLERELGAGTAMRSMTIAELRKLAADPLITIGPHSVTHAALATLTDDAVRAEIADSHAALLAAGLNPIRVLAAPYGNGDARTVRLAREAGMRWTLGIAARTLSGATDSRPLPRFSLSPGRKGMRFALQLAGVAEAIKDMLGRPVDDWPSASA